MTWICSRRRHSSIFCVLSHKVIVSVLPYVLYLLVHYPLPSIFAHRSVVEIREFIIERVKERAKTRYVRRHLRASFSSSSVTSPSSSRRRMFCSHSSASAMRTPRLDSFLAVALLAAAMPSALAQVLFDDCGKVDVVQHDH